MYVLSTRSKRIHRATLAEHGLQSYEADNLDSVAEKVVVPVDRAIDPYEQLAEQLAAGFRFCARCFRHPGDALG